jgi:hypothetical protein
MEDIDTIEICETLNITQVNYWVLIHRCKLYLCSCIEKIGLIFNLYAEEKIEYMLERGDHANS